MKRTFTDQMGRNVEIEFPPQRIVSLVPSQTELLYDLGLGERVVGITKFCIHPISWFRNKTRIGGTKQLNIDRIQSLSPGLIIGNKEENEKAQIELLQQQYPVWMSDINNLSDALTMIEHIGELTDCKNKAQSIIKETRSRFTALPELKTKPGAMYLIWKSPYMAAGTDTYINEMLSYAGFNNLLVGSRYPTLDIKQIKSLSPEFLLLSSEPYPFKEKHIKELQKELPDTSIELVDGEMFSWYGSRLKKSAAYFMELREKLLL